MRIVVQRVKEARVEVNKKVVGAINKGVLLFIGFSVGDENLIGTSIWNKMIKKIINLRIFPDGDKKMNLSLLDVNGEILAVSQFTLYADCKKGNRPSFIDAALPKKAIKLYEAFLFDLRKAFSGKVESGIFGEEMMVCFCNWGPVTIVLDSDFL